MTKYSFSVVIPASTAAPVQVSAAAFSANKVPAGSVNMFSSMWLPAAKLIFQISIGSTGFVFIGGSGVTSAGTSDVSQTLMPGSPTTNPGGTWTIESHTDHNTIELDGFWIHGAHAGDTVEVVYFQN